MYIMTLLIHICHIYIYVYIVFCCVYVLKTYVYEWYVLGKYLQYICIDVKAEDSVYFMWLMRNECDSLEINSRIRWFVGWFVHSTARPRSPAQHLCPIRPAGGDQLMTGVSEMIIKLSFLSRKFARRCFEPTTTAHSHRESVRLPPLPVFGTFSNLQDLRVTCNYW